MSADIISARMTAEALDQVVVFIIGMRINRILAFGRWLRVARSMTKMLSELRASPTSGFLHAEAGRIGLRTFMFIQYWKDFDALEAYARDPDQTHWPAWRDFNKKIAKDSSVGIFHETYIVAPDRREAIYVNMPRFGLGAAVGLIAAVGSRTEARTRMTGYTS